jgi:hypothetical protein
MAVGIIVGYVGSRRNRKRIDLTSIATRGAGAMVPGDATAAEVLADDS